MTPGKASFLLKKGSKFNRRWASQKKWTSNLKSLVGDYNEEEEEDKSNNLV